MAKSLFITPEDVFANTLISGDVDNDKITPHIEAAQDVDLFNILGQNLYEHIDQLVFNTSIQGNTDNINSPGNSAYRDLLVRFITPYLEQYAAARFLQYARYTVSEKGVFVHSSTDGTPAPKNEVEDIAADIRERGERYGENMWDHLANNSRLYPEYTTTNGEQTPPSHTPFDFGFASV